MNYALILAGGVGKRFGSSLPKQFNNLGGVPVIWHAIKRFHEVENEMEIFVALHPDYFEYWNQNIQDLERVSNISVHLVEGGDSRIQSVRNGLHAIREFAEKRSESNGDDIVLIHDGARPFVTERMIVSGLEAVERGVGAIPTIPLTDSIRMKTDEDSKAIDRSNYMAVQTPQVFLLEEIDDAYSKIEHEEGLTDDASVAEQAGLKITTFEGSPVNIKLTQPYDLIIAEALL